MLSQSFRKLLQARWVCVSGRWEGAGEELAELCFGQRALWGVLLDLAACILVTQACWLSPTHNAPWNSAPQRQSSLLKAPSYTFKAPCHQIFIHCPYLLGTSFIFNLWLSAPGQATSSVWVSEKERVTHSLHVCSSSVSAFGKGGYPSRLTSFPGP